MAARVSPARPAGNTRKATRLILRRTSKPGGSTPTLQRNAAYYCLSFARLSLAWLFTLGRVLTWLDLKIAFVVIARSSRPNKQRTCKQNNHLAISWLTQNLSSYLFETIELRVVKVALVWNEHSQYRENSTQARSAAWVKLWATSSCTYETE
jgi:hypothetical protein